MLVVVLRNQAATLDLKSHFVSIE